MKNFFSRFLVLVVTLYLGVASVRAETMPDRPEYAGSAFDGITDATQDAALFFGFAAALCVIVTGFYIGRKWLRSAA